MQTLARRRLLLSAGLGLCLPKPGTAAAMTVRHAMLQQQNAEVLTYEGAVLRLLLAKTEPTMGAYTLQPSPVVSQRRAFLQLAAGELDVLSTMSSTERESQGIPIRVCLYRGLLGVRLPIALARRKAELEAVRELAEARRLRLAQVADWPDAEVLAANGWPVQRLTRMGVFAELLRRERIDLFALGAIEVYPIIDPQPELAVLEQWTLAYPAAYYFFVSPSRPELAQRLSRGWELALADGSFEALFEQWVGPQLARARLAERRWLLLRNPDLPPATPVHNARLWHPLVYGRLFARPG